MAMLSTDDLVNGGIVAAAVLAILLVALSTYGRRRRHPAVRFLVWGASIVFLPLTSSIISSLLDRSTKPNCDGTSPPSGKQNPDIQNMWTILLWIVLMLTIKSNADVAAAAVTAAAASPVTSDVSVDSQTTIRPPLELVANYAWVAFLIWLCVPLAGWLGRFNIAIFIAFTALGLVKVVINLGAFWTAFDSFALGNNARLVDGDMAELVGDGQQEVPRYIVTGEKKEHFEEITHGYRVKRDVLSDDSSSLVTLDRVWRLAEHGARDGVLAEPKRELRDLCLSYSLFKILRRRLSGYPFADDAESRESLSFVLRGMDSAGAGANADRVFRVLADALSFASDFYYSPIPLCAVGGWWATLNYLCSVLIIVGAIVVGFIYEVKDVVHTTPYKVITYSLLVAVVLVEAWEIVAGVCSNWTKMALLGHYIRHGPAWRRYSFVRRSLAAVLRLRPPTQRRHEMGQTSVLEPRRFRRRVAGLLSENFYGRAGLMRSVKVSPDVKKAVFTSLRSSNGRVSGYEGGSSNTELILTWHIGTTLFGMKSTSSSPEMEAARQLSNYCAYLVAAAPELLPDSAAWTVKRYKDVSADVLAALGAGGGGESPAGRYERLVAALSARSRDKVVRRGAELGKDLVTKHAVDEAAALRILVDFWSQMLLYLALSENVKGHVEAMARGGEFITLVWALLLHAGVATRPATSAGATMSHDLLSPIV